MAEFERAGKIRNTLGYLSIFCILLMIGVGGLLESEIVFIIFAILALAFFIGMVCMAEIQCHKGRKEVAKSLKNNERRKYRLVEAIYPSQVDEVCITQDKDNCYSVTVKTIKMTIEESAALFRLE